MFVLVFSYVVRDSVRGIFHFDDFAQWIFSLPVLLQRVNAPENVVSMLLFEFKIRVEVQKILVI